MSIEKGSKVFDSIENLQKKNNPEFKKFFRGTGYDKAHVFYWSQNQISLYNHIQNSFGTPVSVDATGSVVQKN